MVVTVDPFQFHLKGKHNQKTHGRNASHIPDVTDTVSLPGGHVGQVTEFLRWQNKDWLKVPSVSGKKKWFEPDDLKVVTKGPGIDGGGSGPSVPPPSLPSSPSVSSLAPTSSHIPPVLNTPSPAASSVAQGQHHVLAAPPSTMPPVSEMSLIPNSLEGMHSKELYVDKQGRKWMFKGDWASGVSEVAGYRVAQMLGVRTPEVHQITLHGKTGSIQQMFPDVAKPVRINSLKDLSPKQVGQVQAHHVIDWLISQHDTNDGAMLISHAGDVLAIDKGQAFKFFGKDRLDWKYQGNPNPIVYNQLMKAHIKGYTTLDRAPMREMVAKVKALPDAAFLEALKPVAELHAKNGWTANVSTFNAKILARKHSIQTDFEKLYDGLDQARKTKDVYHNF